MSKIDFKRVHKDLFFPPKKFVVIEVPEMDFLMVDGHGDPNISKDYQDAIEVLYAASYKLKFFSKNELGRDYVVPPLEGLWWADDMDSFQSTQSKSEWDWTMMIMTPYWILPEHVYSTFKLVGKGKSLTALEKLRYESYHEGLSIQIMHIGPYDDEAPTLAKLHDEYIPQNGFSENGKHHEIYLSDPRRVPPEKLKTILRQPVKLLT